MKKQKINAYKGIRFNYNILSIILIVTLNTVILQNMEQRAILYNKEINKRVVDKLSGVYSDIDSNIESFIKRIYREPSVMRDIVALLENNYNDYTKIKLDMFSRSSLSYYKGVAWEIDNLLQTNHYIENIALSSNIKNTKYIFNKKTEDTEPIIDKINKDTTKNKLILTENIYNPANLMLIGSIVFNIDTDSMDKLLAGYLDGRVLITKNDEILYDYGNKDNKVELSYKKGYIYTKKNLNIIELGNDIKIVGIFKVKNTLFQDMNILMLIIVINALVLVFIQYIIYKKLKKLNYRLYTILNTIKNINIDNKLQRIPENVIVGRDELSLICTYFNEMCDDLESYIEKYYISQINEKNAEMKFLQSHINPHFLYNVLESIRMKAIINKDKEVARMIYLLAHLFRNQIKEKDEITIESELEYLNKFLEIYKFRYEKAISYSVECEEMLLKQKIIKFILQPLIENYFIHGVRLEDDDNIIVITIKSIANFIIITIKDNGRGISKNTLQDINENIKSNKTDYAKIGIVNVDQRIKIKYGDKYGIVIHSTEKKGTKITIKLPYIKEEVKDV